jgi:hypothetical protein
VQLQPVTGECAWHGEALASSDRWRFRLTPDHLAELEAALNRATRIGIPRERLTPQHFPLPLLSRDIATMSRELEHGCGMVHVSGFPVERYTDAELRTLWMGFGAHFGALRYQNAHGELLREIRDEGADRGERYGQVRADEGTFLSSRARVASTGELRFHTDRADVVALLCVRPAREGGATRIASSVAVYNAMLERRPDLAALLFEDIHRSRLGEEEGGGQMSFALPVFGLRDGRFTSHYSRTYVEAAQLQDGVPRLGAAHWQALDLLAELAEELCIEQHFAPGDVQLLNSHVTYHARSAYRDDPAPRRKRLLYRLWICPPDSRALPPGHEVLWGSVQAGTLRGGIGQAGAGV